MAQVGSADSISQVSMAKGRLSMEQVGSAWHRWVSMAQVGLSGAKVESAWHRWGQHGTSGAQNGALNFLI